METDETIEHIVDLIEMYGNENILHPNNSVKIFAASRLVDAEVSRRMSIINERNKNAGAIYVGHCGSDCSTPEGGC